MKKAIILFSGGLDSTTCLAIAKSQGFSPIALSFSYGQKHSAELHAAKIIAKKMAIPHTILDLPVGQLGGSALTDDKMTVADYNGSDEIPTTYVPARNTIFLSFALGLAEVSNATDIFIGVSAVDYSGYPDCRPAFIQAFEQVANLATKIGVEKNCFKIHAPLSHLSKQQTIELGIRLGVDYSLTVSCYRANAAGEACGKCDSCVLRKKGFSDAALDDPTHYT